MTNNPIDSLLKFSMEFLDVQDLPSVNKILEETSRAQYFDIKKKVPLKKDKKKVHGGVEYSEDVAMFEQFTGALGEEGAPIGKEEENESNKLMSGYNNPQGKDGGEASAAKNQFSAMPTHLLNSYYLLRHMRTRDIKIKLLSTLNYFRAVQKRLTLDMREFATRDRVMGNMEYVLPKEATKVSQRNAAEDPTLSINASRTRMKAESDKNGSGPLPQATGGEGEEHVTDAQKYKYRDRLSVRHLSTCPVVPRFHATFGEGLERQEISMEMEKARIALGSGGAYHDESRKLIGRADRTTFDMANEEILVRDDFGVSIIYDCALDDMKEIEQELLRVGSLYINKQEALTDAEGEQLRPPLDRLAIVEDLIQSEFDYQFAKARLVFTFMECYEHIVDPLEQQRFIQAAVDMMAWRPRLNLHGSNYFVESYKLETECLKRMTLLFDTVIDY